MNCKHFMLAYLAQKLCYDLLDTEAAYRELEDTQGGNPEDRDEPWSGQNYNGWASRLTAHYGWSVSGKDLKEARDAWLAERTA